MAAAAAEVEIAKEEGGGGCHSVEISPKACYKQKQNQTHYENITH